MGQKWWSNRWVKDGTKTDKGGVSERKQSANMDGGRELKRSVDVFFFKQKTAYEIGYGLVGSEMCIRDRPRTARALRR